MAVGHRQTPSAHARTSVARHRTTVAATVLAVLLGHVVAPGSAGATADRIAGASRYDTAVAISQRGFPDGATAVYLARADVFVDALAAGVLTDGPILLVPRCDVVPPAVAAEVDRLGPDVVVALGGPGAVCDDVLTTAAGGRPTDRVSGGDRITTAVAIATRAFPDRADVVHLASSSESSPDAVAGGALTDGPILLTPPGGPLPDATLEAIRRLGPRRVVALGGPVAVSDEVLEAAADGLEAGRHAGADRTATSAAIALAAFPTGAARVYLANDRVFADAVAAGALTDAPVLLVPACGTLPSVVSETMSALGATRAIALGGTSAVCQDLLDQANAQAPPDLPPPTPGPPVEVVHVVPSDGTATAGIERAMSHEMELVARWFLEQSDGVGLRFEFAADRIRARVVQVPATSEELADPVRVRQALAEVGEAEAVPGPNDDYGDVFVVYADVPGPGCGASAVQVAVLYMPSCNIYPEASTPEFPFGATYLAAHELTHALGAVPACAPHEGRNGHVTDAPTDLLYSGDEQRVWDALVLDEGRDDYYRHGREDCPDIDDRPFWNR